MRQMEPEEFQCMRGTVFDRGRSGPAGLNAAHVDALNDPAVRKQLENLGLQMRRQRTSARPKRSAPGKRLV
jgi:hypothetical protein